ncbi:glycosyltransferase family 4 protein [Clostridium perfringens]|uniref:glycosyltransferase family 4 protein n=1 Tax=Clostridium perfringens TaxID=1502 RepID=UPI0032E38064
MANKKILFISNIADEKIGSFSLASIKAAERTGFEFHIASNFDKSSIEQRKKDEEKYNIKIHHIDFIRNPLNPKNVKAYKQILKLMKQENFDVVHCNTPVGGVYGRLAAKKCRIKTIIYQVHGFHFYKGAPKLNWMVYYPIEKILAHITDIIITINHEDFNFAQKLTLRKKGNVYYVPGVGIDIEIYKNIEINRIEYRKSIGLKDTDIVLISVGRLDPNKNNSTLIKSIFLLEDPKFHLVICGSGVQDKELKKLAKDFNVENQIHFLGNRLDMAQLYKMSDIFVMASFREGLSRAIMEAMASGLPCVVSKIRGNKDLIHDDKGGFLVNPNHSEEFTEKFRLLKDNTVRKGMSDYNLNMIKKFSIENVIDNLESIYKMLYKN